MRASSGRFLKGKKHCYDPFQNVELANTFETWRVARAVEMKQLGMPSLKGSKSRKSESFQRQMMTMVSQAMYLWSFPRSGVAVEASFLVVS